MKKLPSNVNFRYLYQPGDLEKGRQRATDPIWSLKVYNVLPPLVKAQRANCVSARRPETGVLCVKSCLLFCLTLLFLLPPPSDTQQAPCGSRSAAPTVCRNRTKPQLILGICSHRAFHHPEPPVCGFVLHSVQRCLVLVPCELVLSLGHTLR